MNTQLHTHYTTKFISIYTSLYFLHVYNVIDKHGASLFDLRGEKTFLWHL